MFFQEYNVCKMVDILPRTQCVKFDRLDTKLLKEWTGCFLLWWCIRRCCVIMALWALHLVSVDKEQDSFVIFCILTHWGRVTHICVGNLTIIGSDNGLSPGRRQAIIWANAGILLVGHWGTNFSEILFDIQTFLFKKMHLKMSSAKWRPFCLGLNVLR